MSYILEALRRAESERERKRGVPGLHTQPVPAPTNVDGPQRSIRPLWWVVAGLLVGVLVMALWRWWGADAPSDDAALARAPVAGNVTPRAGDAPTPSGNEPAPAPATSAPPPANDTAVPPAPVATATPPAAKAAPKSAAPTPSKTSPHPANTPLATNAPRQPAATHEPALPGARHDAPRTPPAAQPAAPPPAPEQRLRSLAELPDDLRRSVPALAFGGSVYSEVATQRMVIFNGQVLREGDALNDDLMLEQIRPKSAVLRLRGQRFEVPF